MNPNELLKLKGTFERRSAAPAGPPTLPKDASVPSQHLRDLSDQLYAVLDFWNSQEIRIDPLVSVYYTRVVAKSNRVHRLLSSKQAKANDSIVGARFYDGPIDPKHLVTHNVKREVVMAAIQDLRACAQAIDDEFGSQKFTSEQLDAINKKGSRFTLGGLAKSVFGQIVRDAFYVEKFGVYRNEEEPRGSMVVSLFETSRPATELLEHYHIDVMPSQILDNAILLPENEFRILQAEAPFLIAMSSTDMMTLDPGDFSPNISPLPESIPAPGNEPSIGVIDTGFFKDAYFEKWVVYNNRLSADIELNESDRKHGTAVSSIIVDGPALNPSLDDGCGRFRVNHFTVAKSGKFSSFDVMRKTKSIVEEHASKGIKVWNLSLGSEFAVRANSVSPEAAILDDLQHRLDVVFVVAGTNKTSEASDGRIGAPADSINSLVVNSVDFDGAPASYTRRGPVLEFFAKPDICYYGGTEEHPLTVAGLYATYPDYGTSFAAPWIARKLAYLIYTMELPKEVAKALIVDSATSWGKIEDSTSKGYGVVPIRIEDILYAPKDEIKFVISEIINSYETLTYNLPVPLNSDGFPYIAKATLCYFPACSRSQGVDYTNTEVSLRIGRVAEKKKERPDGSTEIKTFIKPINNDSQDTKGVHINEKMARENYRKWDNIKHVGEVLKSRSGTRKTYGTDRWGIGFCVKERLDRGEGRGMRVGLVVTLKELNGVNRIETFINSCAARGWIVTRVDMHQMQLIDQVANIDIDFEDDE